MLKFVGCINGENILEIQHCFAVKVSDTVDDEIVKAVTEEARKAGIHDVYLMDRDFVVNALHEAAVAKRIKSTRKPIQHYVEEQRKEIENLKTELAKARGGCQKLRESKEELQECVQTLKKNFDEERDARIKRDKQYADLFEKYEQLKKNGQGMTQYRPCYVGDRIALFHGWFSEHARSYRNPEPINTIYGLVEFETGLIKKVYPYEICFMDHECHRVWEARK